MDAKCKDLSLQYESSSLRCTIIKEIKEKELSCPICLNDINDTDQVWNCKVCFKILHLRCMKRWQFMLHGNKIPTKCPSCNHRCSIFVKPSCFCGKVENPTITSNHLEHSCGEQCQKQLPCGHYCNFKCHPGPHVKCECKPFFKFIYYFNILIYWMIIGFKQARYIFSFEFVVIFFCQAITEISITILFIFDLFDEIIDRIKKFCDNSHNDDDRRRRRASNVYLRTQHFDFLLDKDLFYNDRTPKLQLMINN